MQRVRSRGLYVLAAANSLDTLRLTFGKLWGFPNGFILLTTHVTRFLADGILSLMRYIRQE